MPVLKQMHEDKSWRVRQAYTNQIVEILKVIFPLKFSFSRVLKMFERYDYFFNIEEILSFK